MEKYFIERYLPFSMPDDYVNDMEKLVIDALKAYVKNQDYGTKATLKSISGDGNRKISIELEFERRILSKHGLDRIGSQILAYAIPKSKAAHDFYSVKRFYGGVMHIAIRSPYSYEFDILGYSNEEVANMLLKYLDKKDPNDKSIIELKKKIINMHNRMQ